MNGFFSFGSCFWVALKFFLSNLGQVPLTIEAIEFFEKIFEKI